MHSNARSLLDLDPTIALSSTTPTNLVDRHNQLLRKNTDDFSVEDIRFMIGQGTALEILVPLAIKLLEKDILAEGDYFEGDLLLSVISLDETFWSQNSRWYEQISELINKSRNKSDSVPFSKLVEKAITYFLGLHDGIKFR